MPHDIYQELIEIDTTESSGSVIKAAQPLAQRLLLPTYSIAGIAIDNDDIRDHGQD